MKINIFELGFVGAMSAGCLAKDGHTVIRVDADPKKTVLINFGNTPTIEKDIGDIINDAVRASNLSATNDALKAVLEADLSMIRVDTPSESNGELNLNYVRLVCEEVGAYRDFIINKIPQISRMMVSDIDDVYADAKAIVIGNGAEEFKTATTRVTDGQLLVDLVRIGNGTSSEFYDGICW